MLLAAIARLLVHISFLWLDKLIKDIQNRAFS